MAKRILVTSQTWLLLVSATILSSPQTGQARLDRTITLDEAPAVFYDTPELFEMGWSVSFAGDVNGDGFDDLLFGASLNDDSGFETGKVHLLLGQSDGYSGTIYLDGTADMTFLGAENNDLAGWSLSEAGDLDKDGFDDFLIGGYGAYGQSGATYIYYGHEDFGQGQLVYLDTAPAILVGRNGGDAAGFSLSSAGDVNGDGFSDILISGHKEDRAAKNAGAAYLFFGSGTRFSGEIDIEDADVTLLGNQGGQQFGTSVHGGYDVNGDGFDDLLIGAPKADPEGRPDAGAAFLFFGSDEMPSSLSASDAALILGGESTTNNLGSSVALIQDLLGDGKDDLMAGSTLQSSEQLNAGKGYLVPGAESWTTQNIVVSDFTQIKGNGELDYAGAVVTSAGDLDGDSLGDFLISAHYADTATLNTGEIGVFYGGVPIAAEGHLSDAPAVIQGHQYGELAGASIATEGDFDGDGYPDIAIGKPGAGSISLLLMGRYIDEDGDGSRVVDNDCNDHDSSVGPDFTEYCDGIDNSCNGLVDEDCTDEGTPTPLSFTPTEDGGEATPNDSTPDDSTPDGSTPDDSTPDGSTPDDSTPDGSTPDGSTPDGSTPDGSTPDGSTPDGSTPEVPTQDHSTSSSQPTPSITNPSTSSPSEWHGRTPTLEPGTADPNATPAPLTPTQEDSTATAFISTTATPTLPDTSNPPSPATSSPTPTEGTAAITHPGSGTPTPGSASTSEPQDTSAQVTPTRTLNYTPGITQPTGDLTPTAQAGIGQGGFDVPVAEHSDETSADGIIVILGDGTGSGSGNGSGGSGGDGQTPGPDSPSTQAQSQTDNGEELQGSPLVRSETGCNSGGTHPPEFPGMTWAILAIFGFIRRRCYHTP